MEQNRDYSSENTNLSFVVRMWLEEVDKEADNVLWRGQVINVLTGESIYFQDTADLKTFIETQQRKFITNT